MSRGLFVSRKVLLAVRRPIWVRDVFEVDLPLRKRFERPPEVDLARLLAGLEGGRE